MPRIDADAIERRWDRDAGRRTGRGSPAGRRDDRGADADRPVARVVGLRRGHVDVLLDGEVVAARYAGGMRGQRVVVGDRVRVRPPLRATDVARVTAVLERDTVLLRSADDVDDADDDEHVVVANADRVAVVLAADHLDRGVGFLDRVLVAASIGHLGGLVVVNRTDLVADRDPVDAVAERYGRLGYPLVRTSAVTGAGLDDLRAALAGRWTVMCGHSGVGKSSLFNLLVPDADRKVAETGRYGGRHTTVSVVAMRVGGRSDAWVVDTPGVRAFGLGGVGPQELRYHFPELAELTCELPDCMHDREPACLVPNLGPEDVHPARYDSYLRILAALRAERGT